MDYNLRPHGIKTRSYLSSFTQIHFVGRARQLRIRNGAVVGAHHVRVACAGSQLHYAPAHMTGGSSYKQARGHRLVVAGVEDGLCGGLLPGTSACRAACAAA